MVTPHTDDKAFLSFSLGPVQPFIEAARTLRDLWTGSYLLSYLTAASLRPIVTAHGEQAIISPSLQGNQFWDWWGTGARQLKAGPLLPCLPNRFLAEVPAAEAEPLARAAEEAARQAWRELATTVRQTLHDSFADSEWDSLWDQQIEQYFEFRAVILSWADYPHDRINELLPDVTNSNNQIWHCRWEVLNRLGESQRSVRQFPHYAPAGPVPMKCSLLGTYEQMGPASLSESATFWANASRYAAGTRLNPRDRLYAGTRLNPRDRLCAISLVKRFAWAAYLHRPSQLNRDKRDLRLADTATVAARLWLEEQQIRPQDFWNRRQWSGQWLHWASPNQEAQDGEPECPTDLWQQITTARREKPIPSYYAIIMLDGDRMGETLRSASRVDGADGQRAVSQVLTHFATSQVQQIVDRHHGELIYAGGDDVLALVPAASSLLCAKELSDTYRQTCAQTFDRYSNPSHKLAATVSAGLAVVHYKEDLRFALNQARKAEKAAKNAGRNCLGLSVCRRSGEHSLAICQWELVPKFAELVAAFVGGASDRWAYHLAADEPAFRGFDQLDIIQSLIRRQIGRAEQTTHELLRQSLAQASTSQADAGETIASLFEQHHRQTNSSSPAESFRSFLTLVQSASFLARGRDQ